MRPPSPGRGASAPPAKGSPSRVKPPASVVISVTVSSVMPSWTMTSMGWKAAVHVMPSSPRVSTYMRPPSTSTGLSAPPVKASPLKVKPPPSAVISVTVSPLSPSATSTASDWNGGGGAGAGAGGVATGAGSSPPHPAKPSAIKAHKASRDPSPARKSVVEGMEEST